MIVLTDTVHPGKVLKDLYLDPLNMSASALAGRVDLTSALVVRLIKSETAVTADTALRLGRFFSTTAEYWMNLQRDYDLFRARQRLDVARIQPLRGE